jgi:hypothetical protein
MIAARILAAVAFALSAATVHTLLTQLATSSIEVSLIQAPLSTQ